MMWPIKKPPRGGQRYKIKQQRRVDKDEIETGGARDGDGDGYDELVLRKPFCASNGVKRIGTDCYGSYRTGTR